MPQESQEFQPSSEQLFQAHDSIGTIVALKEPHLIKAHVDKLFPKAKDLLFEYLITIDPELNQRPYQPIAEALWTDLDIQEKFLAHQSMWPKERRELFRHRMESGNVDSQSASHPEPQSATDLLAEPIAPPLSIVEDLMHEGMLLFGGKSKRGKSWLMLDLALAVATGGRVWRHFPVAEPQPVLYLALEDGKARIQRRVRAIQPDIEAADHLHLLYDFPLLSDGGIDALQHYIRTYRYRLIIIDVLAKVERPASGSKEKSYHEIYGMFGPLQELRHRNPFCLALLTHLRKAEADDVFDTLHGSVAYQGAQDVLWVLERRPQDQVGVLHVRDKDAEDQTLHVAYADGHWEFLGYDPEVKLSRDRRAILDLFQEEERALSVDEVFKALTRPQSRYEAVKKTLQRMVRDEQLVRIDRGRYVASRDALQGEFDLS